MSAVELEERLLAIGREIKPPEQGTLFSFLTSLAALYVAEDERMRPRDRADGPGALVQLDPELPCVIIPDIHARRHFVLRALRARPAALDGDSVLESLAAGACQLVCLGDYFHAEGRARERWGRAFAEFSDEYREHDAMDAEMTESLGVLRMLGELKLALPDRVHLLKGNHENVANEASGGNRPFGKYAYEGAMVSFWIECSYGERTLSILREIEHAFPLVALSRYFAASHAEPAFAVDREAAINARLDDELVYALTWTQDGGAESGSVSRSLDALIPADYRRGARWLGGHRPVSGLYQLRGEGEYIRLNNPDRDVIAVLRPDRAPDPDRDILDLGETEEIPL